jgi:hypothetical protein
MKALLNSLRRFALTGLVASELVAGATATVEVIGSAQRSDRKVAQGG